MQNNMYWVYGVVEKNGSVHEVSNNEREVKRYATDYGYTKITRRFSLSCVVIVVAEKINGKWTKVE